MEEETDSDRPEEDEAAGSCSSERSSAPQEEPRRKRDGKEHLSIPPGPEASAISRPREKIHLM